MKTVEKALSLMDELKDSNKFLEVACGCAEMSIEASKIVKEVHCIDLDDFRLRSNIHEYDNVHFKKMDATNMGYEDNTFDIVVIYNAVKHLDTVLQEIIRECTRVLKDNGKLYIISTFSIDKPIIKTELPRILGGLNLEFISLSKGKLEGIEVTNIIKC